MGFAVQADAVISLRINRSWAMSELTPHRNGVVDADDQETSVDFTALRREKHPASPAYTCVKLAGAAVRGEVMRLADCFEDVLIDTGGRDTSSQRAALSVADVLLMPFIPRSFDLWSLEQAAALVEEISRLRPDWLVRIRIFTVQHQTTGGPINGHSDRRVDRECGQSDRRGDRLAPASSARPAYSHSP